MRSRNSNWFEIKVRYDKTQEDGQQKKVTETYVVDALSFGEAEERISKEMSQYIEGEFEVKAITPASYNEIFFSHNDDQSLWYKVKLDFLTIDERTENEKRKRITYLVQGNNLDKAKKNTEEIMNGTMIDYVIASIVETKILDVFEAQKTGDSDTKSDTKATAAKTVQDEFE